MKKIIVLFCMIVLMSCQENSEKNSSDKSGFGDFRVFVIDGCEYLLYGTDKSFAFSHKGNCKNHQLIKTKSGHIIDGKNGNNIEVNQNSK
jgi:hypothetical protein